MLYFTVFLATLQTFFIFIFSFYTRNGQTKEDVLIIDWN